MANDAGAAARFLTTTEIVAEARKNLSDTAWDYVCGGAETETTVLRNRYALDAIAFRPRVLRNVDGTDVTRSAFGAKRRLPVLLAPLGGMTEFHEAGALSSAEAAREFGCLMMLSSVTEPDLEVVAEVGRQAAHLPTLRARRRPLGRGPREARGRRRRAGVLRHGRRRLLRAP